MFNDAEEELRTYRKKPSPYRAPSNDSLYDSLASELETSDSGWAPRYTHPPRLPSEDTPRETPLSIQTTTPLPCESLLVIEEKKEEVITVMESPHLPIPSITATEEESEEECKPSTSREHPEEPSEEETSRKLPLYLDPPQVKKSEDVVEEGGRSPSPSASSLSDYEAPILGEPGVPGTRDLRVSLKKETVERQVRKEACKSSPPVSINSVFSVFLVRLFQEREGV